MSDGGRFLRSALVFLAPLVAAFAAVEARISAIPNAYTYKLSLVEAQREALEVVVLGSSHEFDGIDTDVFSRPAVNLAMPSQSLTQSAELALGFLRVNRIPGQATGLRLAVPRLRHILLGVSYYSLPYRMSSVGDDRMGMYMRAYGVFGDTTFRDRINPSNYLYMGIYGWPVVQGLARGRVPDYIGAMNRTGSRHIRPGPTADMPRFTFDTAASRALYHHSIGREENVAINLAYMRRLAVECRTRNVTLILVTSPITAEYAAAFGDAAWQPRRALLEAFSRELSVRYLDYSRSDAFGWRDFANGDHLNSDGAARFGRILSEVVAK